MTTGTKSLLFGVHQFAWHPFTVLVAWWALYGRPTWREFICIIVHDWGYWSSPHMDDERGQRHPAKGACLVMKWFGEDLRYFNLVLYHSRHYAKMAGAAPSRLCWADKLSIRYDPITFYLFRAWLSGELEEYRRNAHEARFVPEWVSHRKWAQLMRAKFTRMARERRGDVVPYQRGAV